MCPPDLLRKIILVVPAAFNLMQRYYSGAEIWQESIGLTLSLVIDGTIRRTPRIRTVRF
jgi:hypothetical protein